MMLFIVESVLLNRQEEIEEPCADQVIILYNVQKQRTIKQLSKDKSIKVNECHIHVFKESYS